QPACAQALAAGDRNRRTAEALHRKAEISEAVVLCQDLAQHAEGTRVEILGDTAVRSAQAVPQEAGLAESPHQLAAARIHGGPLRRMRARVEAGRCPPVRLGREPPVRLVEE